MAKPRRVSITLEAWFSSADPKDEKIIALAKRYLMGGVDVLLTLDPGHTVLMRVSSVAEDPETNAFN